MIISSTVDIVLSQISHHWDIIPDIHNIKEKRLNVTHSFQRFIPQSVGSQAETVWQKDLVEHSFLIHGRQEVEEGNSTREGKVRPGIVPNDPSRHIHKHVRPTC